MRWIEEDIIKVSKDKKFLLSLIEKVESTDIRKTFAHLRQDFFVLKKNYVEGLYELDKELHYLDIRYRNNYIILTNIMYITEDYFYHGYPTHHWEHIYDCERDYIVSTRDMNAIHKLKLEYNYE